MTHMVESFAATPAELPNSRPRLCAPNECSSLERVLNGVMRRVVRRPPTKLGALPVFLNAAPRRPPPPPKKWAAHPIMPVHTEHGAGMCSTKRLHEGSIFEPPFGAGALLSPPIMRAQNMSRLGDDYARHKQEQREREAPVAESRTGFRSWFRHCTEMLVHEQGLRSPKRCLHPQYATPRPP